jgi:3-dehydroquinate dehydratase-2
MASLLLLNGPNLNLLGTREPGVYGSVRLGDIETRLQMLAQASGHTLAVFQSNAEHEIVDHIQQASPDGVDFILLNPGAFTHTSVAMRDALLAVEIPFIEVHLSNVFAREEFRHSSYFSDIATGCIFGLGAVGYELALQAAIKHLSGEI